MRDEGESEEETKRLRKRRRDIEEGPALKVASGAS